MLAAMTADWSGDARRAKLLMMFCALGCALFLLDLAAGVWLWKYVREYSNVMPAYDRFLSDVRLADPQALADIAFKTQAGWEACEEVRIGVQETVVHITIAASFVGLVLFTLCFLLGFLLHRNLLRLPGGSPVPIPPDDVDGTWR